MESVLIHRTTCNFLSNDDLYRRVGEWFASASSHHIVTLNPEMVVEAHHNPDFLQAVSEADIRIPDGAGMFWARSYLQSQQTILASLISFVSKPTARITGVDMLVDLVTLATKANQSVYLLGGTPTQAQATASYLSEQIPNSSIHTGPIHTFDLSGPKSILDDIQSKAPGLLLVAYGAPKQTLWIQQHKNVLPSVRVATGIGGAFAMVSRQTPRAPKGWQRHNLEWLWRLALEPHRLPRIYRAVISFPLLVRQQKRGKVSVDGQQRPA